MIGRTREGFPEEMFLGKTLQDERRQHCELEAIFRTIDCYQWFREVVKLFKSTVNQPQPLTGAQVDIFSLYPSLSSISGTLDFLLKPFEEFVAPFFLVNIVSSV